MESKFKFCMLLGCVEKSGQNRKIEKKFKKLFQPELWIRHNHDSPDDSDMIVSEPPKVNPKEMSEQERIIRQNMRHQKFGKLAKLLAKRFPNDEISSEFFGLFLCMGQITYI